MLRPCQVRALCEFGADVNCCDERGRSPLYVALLNGAGDVAAYLLGRPDQRLASPLGGSTLLHAACQCQAQAAAITAALLARGCPLDRPDRLGNLPLHEALCWENVEVVRALLLEGACPSACGEMRALPLTFAARMGCVQMAELLLAAGADLNGVCAQVGRVPGRWTCMHTSMRTCTCTHTHARTDTQACMHARTHAQTHKHARMHAHTQTHTHTNTHTQRPKDKDRFRTMPPHSGINCHILSVTPATLNSSKGH